jgi:hypothetical protein
MIATSTFTHNASPPHSESQDIDTLKCSSCLILESCRLLNMRHFENGGVLGSDTVHVPETAIFSFSNSVTVGAGFFWGGVGYP